MMELTRRSSLAFAVLSIAAWILQAGLATAQTPAPGPTAGSGAQFFVMASTTSTEQSGLFGHLMPRFSAQTGIQVRVVALGTGQAIAVAARGDADLLFVHDRVAEEKFVADGHGLGRRDVMYNDFVIVGPRADPAGIAGFREAGAAFRKIAQSRQPFLSRGDRSGTHAAELRIWEETGVDPRQGTGGWYRETGSGMGPTLNIGSSMNGYALTDRGTWLNFRNRGELKVLVEGDSRLFNQYGVIAVNPARHPHVRHAQALSFADWIVSASGQQAIADYKIGGEQLFFPNAAR
jgi:tungstate transport system substrate-binding protein